MAQALQPSPIPHDLREQVINRVAKMADQDVVRLYDLILLSEKIRLRNEISEEAEAERAAGKWDNLSEVIREYRDRNKQR